MTFKKEELKTPYFMINEDKLIENLEKAKQLKEISGVKLVSRIEVFLNLGCFRHHQTLSRWHNK